MAQCKTHSVRNNYEFITSKSRLMKFFLFKILKMNDRVLSLEEVGTLPKSTAERYDEKPKYQKQWRDDQSVLKQLRKFNNWVKIILIHRFTRGPLNSSDRVLNVLDLGCGNGGDILKWKRIDYRIGRYVGLDSSRVSIQRAKERLNSAYAKIIKKRKLGEENTDRWFDEKFIFLEKDCFREDVSTLKHVQDVCVRTEKGHGGFDIVSAMFSAHYAFESEQTAAKMFENVASSLKTGGKFIGCIPNSLVLSSGISRALANLKSRNGEDFSANAAQHAKKVAVSWGNTLFRIDFQDAYPTNGLFNPPYGWKYTFFLEEAIDHIPEFVAPWETFCTLAEKHGLKLVFCDSFNEIWNNCKGDSVFESIAYQLKLKCNISQTLLLSLEEKQICSLYLSFCFIKE